MPKTALIVLIQEDRITPPIPYQWDICNTIGHRLELYRQSEPVTPHLRQAHKLHGPLGVRPRGEDRKAVYRDRGLAGFIKPPRKRQVRLWL